MLTQKNLPGIILGAILILIVVLGVFLFIAPPSVFPDPANGLHVMRSMGTGGGFNRVISPDQEDIAKNTTQFLTWWSPGQYLVPYVFRQLFGVNTGQASALTITLCQLLGLAGFFAFFKKAGFTPLVSALSLLFIACQQFFVVPYIFYNGGEVLLFAFLGWFLYGCMAIKTADWKLALFVLFAGWIGFFCKSSVMWMYVAGLLFVWIRLSLPQKTLGQWFKNAIWIGVPAIISVAAIWLFYLSKGDSPASVSAGLKLTLKTFAFPLASPLLSGFSADDLSHGLIYHTGTPIFSVAQSVIVLLLFAVLSLGLVLTILKRVAHEDYKLMIKIFYAVAFVFFSYAYLRQMPISYEARHFRIIGLLVIPGTICLISQINISYKIAFSVIWTGIAITTALYLVKGYTYNTNKSARGVTGIAQQEIDQKSLNQVLALDEQNTDATFVFVNTSLGLEIKHNRVITLQPIGDDLRINFDDYEYKGHDGPLYIILPESYNGPREKMILKAFPGYKGWYGSMLSEGYVMYAAK